MSLTNKTCHIWTIQWYRLEKGEPKKEEMVKEKGNEIFIINQFDETDFSNGSQSCCTNITEVI